MEEIIHSLYLTYFTWSLDVLRDYLNKLRFDAKEVILNSKM